MKITLETFLWFFTALCLCMPVLASADNKIAQANKNLHDWQLRRLFNPTPQELMQEHNGQQVYIYDGLTDLEVEAAIAVHFDRIENMMFIGTVKTGPSGLPKVDPKTGRAEVESNGCAN